MANILIIDDDETVCKVLCDLFRPMDHHVKYALKLKQGLHKVSEDSYDLVFLDVGLPDGNGLKAIPQIRETPSSPEVIIITGEGNPDGAELAIKSGSWDYIQKPLTAETITLHLTRALQYHAKQKPKSAGVVLQREGIIGDSPQWKHCLELVARAAQVNGGVLITGETGTGKELVASAIHKNSPRHDKTFVVVDCATLPETLVESVLFGHKKGTFTGADKNKMGLIEQADGGTLFLDEVGEIPLSIQSSFLRVIQEHHFRPVGGSKEINSNFRLIAATNRDLDQMVIEGTFRKDLLFRIRSFVIELPPLRVRTQDIRQLAMHYMNKCCELNNKGTKGFSPEFIESLMTYDWPGNVRELINTIESAITTAEDYPILLPRHLPTYIRVKMARESVLKHARINREPKNDGSNSQVIEKFKQFRQKAVAEAEKMYLYNLISITRWNIKEAGRLSGLSQARLYGLLKKHAITKID